jgi:hypothetical protein
MERIANIQGNFDGELKAIEVIPIRSVICEIRIHPLRLPKNGGINLSINGDQRNFIAYGRPTREKIPIVLRSTPSTAIHAWSVPPVSERGIPEENPRNVIIAILRLVNTLRYGEILNLNRQPPFKT